MPANSFFFVCCFSAPYKRTVQHESSSLNKYNIAVQKWNMVYLCEIVFLFILKEEKKQHLYFTECVTFSHVFYFNSFYFIYEYSTHIFQTEK